MHRRQRCRFETVSRNLSRNGRLLRDRCVPRSPLMANPQLVKDLIDAGIHFGHRQSRWNPKMKPFIYGKRNLIHIIDVRETLKGLLAAKRYLNRVVAGGKDVVYVGTKRQA